MRQKERKVREMKKKHIIVFVLTAILTLMMGITSLAADETGDPKEITVTIDASDIESGLTLDMSICVEDTYMAKLSEMKLNRTGYKIAYWYFLEDTDQDGENEEIRINEDTVAEQKHDGQTLYVSWKKETYTLTLKDSVEDKELYDPLSVEYGDLWKNVNVEGEDTAYTPEKAEYSFRGWFLDKDCTEAVADDYSFESDIIFYAKWVRIYKILLDYNDGVTLSSFNEVEDGEQYPFPEKDPIREGYIFEGWYTEKEGGRKVEKNAVFDENERSFFAHWKKIEENISDQPQTETPETQPNPSGDKTQTETENQKNPEKKEQLDTVKYIRIKRSLKDAAKITITWKKVKNAGFYKVEWSTKKKKGFKPITKETKKAKVSWKAKTKGKRYYIRVTAYAKDESKFEASKPAQIMYRYIPTQLKVKKSRVGDQYRLSWAKQGGGIKNADGLEIQQKSKGKWKTYAETQQLENCWKYDFAVSNAKGRTFRVATYFQKGKKRIYGKWVEQTFE